MRAVVGLAEVATVAVVVAAKGEEVERVVEVTVVAVKVKVKVVAEAVQVVAVRVEVGAVKVKVVAVKVPMLRSLDSLARITRSLRARGNLKLARSIRVAQSPGCRRGAGKARSRAFWDSQSRGFFVVLHAFLDMHQFESWY